MFIIQAVLMAKTEHVVHFMLTAWLEALERDGSAKAVPLEVKRLPLRGASDVRRRLAIVREKLAHDRQYAAMDLRTLRDAAAAFSVASEKLRELPGCPETAAMPAGYGTRKSGGRAPAAHHSYFVS